MKDLKWYEKKRVELLSEKNPNNQTLIDLAEIDACIKFVKLTEKKKALYAQMQLVPDEWAAQKRLFSVAQDVVTKQRENLVPLWKIGNSDLITFFSMSITEIDNKIKKKCEDWYNETFPDGAKHKASPLDIKTTFVMNVEYLLSKGEAVIKLALGLPIWDDKVKELSSFDHFRDMYIRYEEEGLHDIIGYYVHGYNSKTRKPYTKKELAAQKAWLTSPECKKMTDDILNEILAEEKE